MKLEMLALAEFANSREGLLNMVGGGINRVTAAEYPVGFGAYLAAMIRLQDESELGTHSFAVELRRRASRADVGGAIGSFDVSKKASAQSHEQVRSVLTVDLRPLVLPGPGDYKVTLRIDDKRLGSVWLYARRAESSGP